MANTLTLTIWIILSGLLIGLIIFFVLTKKDKLVKTNQKQKSLLATTLMGAFFVGAVGIFSYFVLLIQFSGDITGVKFPETGPDPTTLTIIQCTKNLYATPVAGLISSLLLTAIIFLIVTLFRNIFINRRIEKDLEAERAMLAEAKAKDEALLESIGDGVVATDQNGITTVLNESATKMLGWKSGKVLGKKWHDVVRVENEAGAPILPVELPLLVALKAGTTTTTTTTDFVYYFVRKDGTRFPAAITVTPIKLDDRIIGAVEVFRDITKEKEIDRAKSEFVSLASHQLRTPSTSMKWFLEMLLSEEVGPLNEKQKEYFGEVYQNNQRMIVLVDTLLNISRIELGVFKATPKPIDAADLTKEILEEQKLQIQSKKLGIKETYASNLPQILIDPKLLRIVLQNIIGNAIKYTPADGKISIEILLKQKNEDLGHRKIQKNSLVIAISDTGYGIPENQQDKIFTKLFRADNIKEKDTDGTGLGLYLAKSIVDHAQGDLWFESELNHGTTFYIAIPME